MSRDSDKSTVKVISDALLRIVLTWWVLWVGSGILAALRDIATAIREAS